MPDPKKIKVHTDPIIAKDALTRVVNQGWHTEDLLFDADGCLIIRNGELAAQLRAVFDAGGSTLNIILEGENVAIRPMASGTGRRGVDGPITEHPSNMMCPCGPVP